MDKDGYVEMEWNSRTNSMEVLVCQVATVLGSMRMICQLAGEIISDSVISFRGIRENQGEG
jgi:hypothetical protein